MNRFTIRLDDGFRVGVTTAGEGIPLVFLHGLSASSELYVDLFELLAERGFRVIALDAADHGRTHSLSFGHTVTDMVDITARSLDHLGIESAIMMGHSMGGGMVAHFAGIHPERTTMAVLLDGAAGENHHASIKVQITPSQPFRSLWFLHNAAVDLVTTVNRARRGRSFRDHLVLVRRLHKSFSGYRCLPAGYALMRDNTTPVLKAMNAHHVRTIIIHGLQDGIVPFSAAVSAATLSGGQLFSVDDAHSWMVSNPQTAIEIIDSAMREMRVAA